VRWRERCGGSEPRAPEPRAPSGVDAGALVLDDSWFVGALPAHFQQTAGAVLIAPACGFVETITAPSIKAASA
jgi:hypothetical protein